MYYHVIYFWLIPGLQPHCESGSRLIYDVEMLVFLLSIGPGTLVDVIESCL